VQPPALAEERDHRRIGLVDRLEKAGLVRRRSDPNDRRRVLVDAATEPDGPLAALHDRPLGVLDRYTPAELIAVERFVTDANAFLAAERARLRAGPADAAGAGAAPLGKVKSGHLLFPAGAAHLTVADGAGPRELYHAEFQGKPPAVEVDGGTVRVAYPRFRCLAGLCGHAARLELNARIPWDVELRGGVSGARLELGELDLRSLAIGGGAHDVTVELPPPSGVVRVRIAGGAHGIAIARPEGTAASLRVAGGAAGLTFDRQRLGAVGGEARLESTDFEGARDRYELEIVGGANQVRVLGGSAD
jgi:hypothetical protein